MHISATASPYIWHPSLVTWRFMESGIRLLLSWTHTYAMRSPWMVNGCLSVMKNVTKEHTSKEVVVTGVKHVRSIKLIKGKTPITWESQPWRDTWRPLNRGYIATIITNIMFVFFSHDESFIIKHPVMNYDHPCTAIFPFQFILWNQFVKLACLYLFEDWD